MKHISNFTIEQFRRLRGVELKELGAVNLLLGPNNSGKTTVLEALYCFCNPLDGFHWLGNALRRFGRGTRASQIQALKWLFPQTSNSSPDLFYDHGTDILKGLGAYAVEECRAEFEEFEAIRRPRKGAVAREVVETLIGEDERGNSLGRRGAELKLSIRPRADTQIAGASLKRQLTIWDDKTLIKRKPKGEISLPVQFLDPHHFISESASAEKFSDFRRMGLYEEVKDILQRLDNGIKDVLVLSEKGGIGRVYVDHRQSGLTPLSSCGDGIRRALQVAMTVPLAKDGILLIDEIESALHVSVLAEVFALLVQACKDHNVQLFATTHSLEAIDGILKPDARGPEGIVAFRLPEAGKDEKLSRYSGETLHRIRYERGLDVR